MITWSPTGGIVRFVRIGFSEDRRMPVLGWTTVPVVLDSQVDTVSGGPGPPSKSKKGGPRRLDAAREPTQV